MDCLASRWSGAQAKGSSEKQSLRAHRFHGLCTQVVGSYDITDAATGRLLQPVLSREHGLRNNTSARRASSATPSLPNEPRHASDQELGLADLTEGQRASIEWEVGRSLVIVAQRTAHPMSAVQEDLDGIARIVHRDQVRQSVTVEVAHLDW